MKSNEVPNHCHSLSQKESSAIFTQNFCSRFVYCLQARVLIERQGERKLEGGGGVSGVFLDLVLLLERLS